jgi:hypothetical protein
VLIRRVKRGIQQFFIRASPWVSAKCPSNVREFQGLVSVEVIYRLGNPVPLD